MPLLVVKLIGFRASLCAYLVLLIALPGRAQSPSGNRPESPVWTRQELARGIVAVDRLFAAEYEKEHAAGLTVGIVSGPELVWTKSYGLADMEKGKAATDDTIYRIGSITKQFTAVMLLKLVAQGKVHLSC
jgi:CubicO group peptidase (beta-lactamase class C family)